MIRTRFARRLLTAAMALVGCRGEPRKPEASQGTLAPLTASEARRLLARADSTYGREEFDSARAIFDSALTRATKTSDTVAQARALTGIGLAAWHRGRYDDARRFGERALGLKVRAGLVSELFKSYNALGLLAHNQGRFHEALQFFDHAEQAARDVADSAGIAKARGNRGLVYSDIGDFQRARDGIEAMRRQSHDAGNALLEGNALTNLGMVEIRAGNPRDALTLLKDALSLQRASKNGVGEENALGQLGTAYDAMGEPQLAFAYLDSALALAHRDGLRQAETDDLQLIAGLYDESGDHARALEYLRKALPMSDSLGMRNIQGNIARSQARALLALGNVDLARARADAARQFHLNAGAQLEELEDDLLAAELHQRAGARASAAEAIANARALAAKLGSRVARAELALGEGHLADLAGDPRGVLRALPPGQADVAGATTGREWEADALRARAYAQLGQLTDAVAAGRRAMHAVERVRGNLTSGSLRTSYAADRANVYGDLVVALLRLSRTDEAFDIADAVRGRALLEHIAAAGNAIARAPGPGADLVRAEQLLRRIDQLVERLRVADTTTPRRRSGGAGDEAGFLTQELATARHDYETLMQRASVADHRVAAFVADQRSGGSADHVRAALRSDEAMLEYFVFRERLIIFVVTPSAVRSIDMPVGEDALFTRVRLARDLMTRLEASADARGAVLRGLFDILVAPVRAAGLLAGAHTLVVVPHASLAYLPFAALIDRASGQYLVEQYAVLLSPSGASLAAVRDGRGASVLSAGSVFAPFPDDLPGTRAEVIAAKRALTRATAYVGQEASEHALRAALSSSGVVHVATHGVLNVRSPMFSRLELMRAAGGNASFDDDGRLEVHELLDLTIRSPLVFLSGCETGAGAAWSTSFARGEDYATLAEAFLFAGARNVVSTLWRIEDRSASAFAMAFYKEVGNRPPVEALALAQRSLLKEPQYASPYYWAAYTLTGDGHLAAQKRALAAVP